jgi:Bacterial Ig-like domain (group 1)
MLHSSAPVWLALRPWCSFLLKEINMRMRFFWMLLLSACPTSVPVESIACLTKDDCPSDRSCAEGRCILGSASALPVAPPSTLDAIAPVIADEVAQAAIRVTLRDANSAPVARALVTLSASGSNNTFVAMSGLTDATGIFATGMWSSKAETKVITASFGDGQTLSTSVKFNSGPASLLTSTITSDKPSYQADGVDIATLKVTVLDAQSNPVAATNISLTVSGTLNTLSTSAGVTNADGAFITFLQSSKAETKTVTASIGALNITKGITFVTGIAAKDKSTFTLSATARVANGMEASVATVQLLDGNSNPVVNQPVTLSMTGTANVFEPASGVTDDTGKFLSNVKSRSSGVKTVTATAGVLSFTGTVNFEPAPAQWTQRFSANPPSARTGHAMAYDSARKKVVLFGGVGQGRLNDTWEWNGSSWTQIATVDKPSPRNDAAVIFDSSINKVVLFGGYTSNGLYSDETWTYDGTWKQLIVQTRPPARSAAGFVYDSSRSQGLLFGGAGSAGLFDSWLWKDSQWKSVALFFPTNFLSSPNYFANQIIFDPVLAQVFGYEGCNAQNCQSYAYSWATGSSWALVALSPTVAGTPTARSAFAFDFSRNRPMRFGGAVGLTGTSADLTFEWESGGWKALNPLTKPTPLASAAVASDSDRAKVVLFGGQKTAGGLSAETWEYGPQ